MGQTKPDSWEYETRLVSDSDSQQSSKLGRNGDKKWRGVVKLITFLTRLFTLDASQFALPKPCLYEYQATINKGH